MYTFVTYGVFKTFYIIQVLFTSVTSHWIFFLMYLHCLRSFFFFLRERDLLIFLNTGLVYIRSNVFALYIFVTHFERCI